LKIMQTREAFVDWLDRQRWLQDALVDTIEPLPEPGTAPDRVRLVFRTQITGGVSAGDHRRVRELDLSATGISRFELPPGGFASCHCCEGADIPHDSSSAVSLSIDVPLELRLDCAQLQVVEREWDEVVPELFSDREFGATARDAGLPRPEQWLEALALSGLEVVWRYYGGPATPASSVPPEYEGWFLQQTHRIASTLGGVLFLAAKVDTTGFRVHLQRHTEIDDPLWTACARYIGTFRDVEVCCGNTKLSGAAWGAHFSGT
jgi:hypothetical protein